MNPAERVQAGQFDLPWNCAIRAIYERTQRITELCAMVWQNPRIVLPAFDIRK